jgi:hypothetical protein
MVREKVQSYWKLYRNDITKWPSPQQLYEELEDVMAPYGDSRAHRLNKLRGLYNKLTKQCFKDNGKCTVIYCSSSKCLNCSSNH